jgi:hypothetical protein
MVEERERPGEGSEIRSGDETIHSKYDWGELEPSAAVVETVATALDREAADGAPLYGFIDPDALDEIFRSNHVSRQNDVSVSFIVDDRHVTVHSRGDVIVQPK